MRIVRKVANTVKHTLTTLAEEVGTACGIIKRKRVFNAATLAQTVVFGYLHNPEATDEDLARMAAICGAPVTPQAIAQRFTWAFAKYLRELFEAAVKQAVAAPPVMIPLLQRFTSVTVLDSSTITLPAEMAEEFPSCGGNGSAAAMKVQTRLDLLRGKLDFVPLESGRTPDQGSALQEKPLPKGSLRLADLGYFSLAVLAMIVQQGSYWISRIQSGTAVFLPDGMRLSLHDWLKENVTSGVAEIFVHLGAKERLPCRLFAIRVPAEVAARRRQRLHAEERKKGRTASQERLAWCDWTILVTNVEAERLNAKEAVVLYRARWQIELLFKLWKSYGRVDAVTSKKPERQAAEIFGRMLAVTVQHWLMVASMWSLPNRSLMKAVQAIRTFAGSLASLLLSPGKFLKTLHDLCNSICKTARINHRRSKPNTYQLLLNPDLLEYF